MTWGGGRPHAVGDRGQRYEVSYRDPASDDPNKRRVMGWSSTMQGAGSFHDAINAHPVWCDPKITDRENPAPLLENILENYLLEATGIDLYTRQEIRNFARWADSLNK